MSEEKMENRRLDFEVIKQIPIVQVAERFGIKLTGTGKWRYADCPLPSHDPAKLKTKWGVNTERNYWACFSKSCQERRNGAEFGDVITLVQFLDQSCSGARDAAEKLANWYLSPAECKPKRDLVDKPREDVNETKSAPQTQKEPPRDDSSSPSTRGGREASNSTTESGKGYMADTDVWFRALFVRRIQESEQKYFERLLKEVKARLYSSYQAGLKAQSKAA